MPFPWLRSAVPLSQRATFAGKFFEMHRRELAARAGLLARLGHPRAYTERRCRENLVWELGADTALLAEVSRIVAEVYDRGRAR